MRAARWIGVGVGALLASTSVGAEGLVTGPFNRLQGELVVTAPDGRAVGTAKAAVNYSEAAGDGTVSLAIRADGRPVGRAEARFTAQTPGEAAGAVVALVLAATHRAQDFGSSLRLSDLRFEGDASALVSHTETLVDWWDAKGHLALGGRYVTPIDLQPATLLLNVWTTEGSPGFHSTATIVLPGVLNQAGGHVTFDGISSLVADVTQASIVALSPGVFRLDLTIALGSSHECAANLHLLELPDGTVDVRGNADHWCYDIPTGSLVVEGVGDRGVARLLHP
jgi:hypothetical protein